MREITLLRKCRYWVSFLKLVIHSGLVWGCVADTVEEWREQVKSTLLRVELERLDIERENLFEKSVDSGCREE